MPTLLTKTFNQILLVDDDASSNFVNQLLLEDLDLAHRVVVLTDGEQALTYILEKLVSLDSTAGMDLVLLDINMPVMNGLEVLEALVARGHQDFIRGKIITLTTSTHQRDMEQLQRLGVKASITKPLTEEKLYQIVQLTEVS